MSKLAATTQNIAGVTRLFVLADFLKNPQSHFGKIFHSNVSRFGSVDRVFDKLRSDFMFQLTQALPSEYQRGYRESTDQPISEMSFAAASRAMGVEVEKLASLAANKLGVQLSKRQKCFIVARNHDRLKTALSHFSVDLMNSQCLWLAALERDHILSATFGVRNLQSSLAAFLTSLHTVAFPTSSVKFERVLAQLFGRGDTYFTSGYPHDLLAYDVLALLRQPPPKGFLICDKYASSVVVSDVSSAPDGGNRPGYSYFSL